MILFPSPLEGEGQGEGFLRCTALKTSENKSVPLSAYGV